MPSFVYMKILESTPERYDRGIQILSHGRIGEVYERIAETVAEEGKRILDIGCGTGNLSMACARRGSFITGIDINSGMLEIARKKARNAGLNVRAQFLELGVAEIKNRIGENSIDACVSCLVFSELSDDEQSYAISAAHSVLKPGGIIVIADEVVPGTPGRRFLHALAQLPVRILAYALAQASTRPVKDLSVKFQNAGFVDISTTRIWGDTFMIIMGRRRPGS